MIEKTVTWQSLLVAREYGRKTRENDSLKGAKVNQIQISYKQINTLVLSLLNFRYKCSSIILWIIWRVVETNSKLLIRTRINSIPETLKKNFLNVYCRKWRFSQKRNEYLSSWMLNILIKIQFQNACEKISHLVKYNLQNHHINIIS